MPFGQGGFMILRKNITRLDNIAGNLIVIANGMPGIDQTSKSYSQDVLKNYQSYKGKIDDCLKFINQNTDCLDQKNQFCWHLVTPATGAILAQFNCNLLD